MRRLRAIARHVTDASVHAVAGGNPSEEKPAAAALAQDIEVEKLHPDFGALLHNVDLTALTDEQWETIQGAFDECLLRPI